MLRGLIIRRITHFNNLYDIISGLLDELLHEQITSAIACSKQVNDDSEQADSTEDSHAANSYGVNLEAKISAASLLKPLPINLKHNFMFRTKRRIV